MARRRRRLMWGLGATGATSTNAAADRQPAHRRTPPWPLLLLPFAPCSRGIAITRQLPLRLRRVHGDQPRMGHYSADHSVIMRPIILASCSSGIAVTSLRLWQCVHRDLHSGHVHYVAYHSHALFQRHRHHQPTPSLSPRRAQGSTQKGPLLSRSPPWARTSRGLSFSRLVPAASPLPANFLFVSRVLT